MKSYRVTFETCENVEAENRDKAIQKAEEKLCNKLEKLSEYGSFYSFVLDMPALVKELPEPVFELSTSININAKNKDEAFAKLRDILLKQNNVFLSECVWDIEENDNETEED